MSWGRYDDDMLDHEKWRRAVRIGGDGVLMTFERLRSWCSRRLTDGYVPADMVEEVALLRGSKLRAKCLRALIDARLIERHPDGSLVIVGYLERNPSRASVLAERERRAQAQRNRRVAKDVTGHAPTSDPIACSVPSRPVPSRIDPVESASRSDARATPEDYEPPAKTEIRPSPPTRAANDGADPPTYRRIPKTWKATEAFYGEALMAGVSREALDEDITYWRARDLSGEFHDFEAFFRAHFPRLRRRSETDAYQRQQRRHGSAQTATVPGYDPYASVEVKS